jgi:ABC-type branched-subunit amino acid transport system ATPase component
VPSRNSGTTVLRVVQGMTEERRKIADRASMPRTGRLVMQGRAKEAGGNAKLHKVYLGL